MAVVTTGDDTLISDDAAGMLDELLEAQNKSRIFGLKLNLPLHIVDAIHSTYSQPEERLLQVLIEFTKQTDPRPTWTVITDALRSPAVNLPHLAKKVEAAHFPEPTATCNVVSETTAPTATEKAEIQQQLMRKEAELTRAEETIRREQQLVEAKDRELAEAQQQVTEILQAKDGELAQAQQQLRQLEQSSRREIGDLKQQLQSSEALVAEFQKTLQQRDSELEILRSKVTEVLQDRELVEAQQQLRQQFNGGLSPKCVSYTCQVSGPGLHSATANHPTHVLIELSDSSGRPCSLQQNVTAELELVSEATPTSTKSSRWPWSKKPEKCVAVVATSPSKYDVSYTAVSRGQHKLHVRVNNREIKGSPFTMTVYPDPTQLGRPMRVVTGLNGPYGIAFNSRGVMIISEFYDHQISIFDTRAQRFRIFGSRGDSPEQIIYPAGIAIDDEDNIYVSSDHKLQKFTGSGELIKCVGQRGSKEGEFNDPRGVTLYDNQVYVCDPGNHRIQVFDLDLKFIRSIGSSRNVRGELNVPHDVKFDTGGNIYVAEFENGRVQVMDASGRFIRAFGQEGKGKLTQPPALHIIDNFVYVSDYIGNCIVVYETSGQFVTSFGSHGHEEGKLNEPYCITSCADGFIHVCDQANNRVQMF